MNCKNKMASRIFGIVLSVMMVFTGMFSPLVGTMLSNAATGEVKTIEIKGNPTDTTVGEKLTAIAKDENGNVVENAVFQWRYSKYYGEDDVDWDEEPYYETGAAFTGRIETTGATYTIPSSFDEGNIYEQSIQVRAGTGVNPSTERIVLKIVNRDPVDYDNQGGMSDSDVLDAIAAALPKAYTPVFGTDTNIVTYMQGKISAMTGSDGVTVSLKNATEDGSIEADGTINYFYKDINVNASDLAIKHWAQPEVSLTLTKGTATKDVNEKITLNWDIDKLKADLQKYIIDCLTADTFKGENESLEAVTANMFLPAKLEGKKYAELKWTSSDSSVISITPKEGVDSWADGFGYDAKVSRAGSDKTVTLTATIDNYTNKNEPAAELAAVKTLHKEFTITVKGTGAADPEDAMQTALDNAITEETILGYSSTNPSSFEEIDKDITLPRKRALDDAVEAAGYEGSYYLQFESSNDKLLSINGSSGKVIRPLPGEDNVVTLTAVMSDVAYGSITASSKVVRKSFTLTIKPIDGAELSAEIAKDAALIEKVKKDFWNGIKGENTDKEAVNKNLHRFYEANLAANGTDVEYTYAFNDMKNTGIIISDQTVVTGVSDQDGLYIKSSNTRVISDNLLVLQGIPTYDTKVTLTAYLTSARFAKYAKAHPENTEFQSIYKVPVRLTITILGTDGEKPNTGGSTPATMSVDVKVDGKGFSKFVNISKYTYTASASENHTAWDALKAAFDANGYTYEGGGSYVSSVTDAQNHVLAHLVHGENSGWMYNLNGKLSDLVLNNQYIDDGDEIYFFYTGDYKEEPQVKEKGHGGSGAAVADQPKPAAEDPTAQAAIAKTEEKTDAAGNKATIATDVNGKTATKVEVSAEAVKKAAEENKPVALPVPQIRPQADVKKADSVKVELPQGTAKAAVTVPVTGADTNTVLMKVAEDGTLTPVPTAVVTEDGAAVAATVDSGNYVVVENKVEFADVKAGDWFAEGAGFAGSRNLMVGVGGGKFDQAGKLTTAQTAAVIGRLKGEGTSESWNKAVAQFGNAQVNSRENTIGMLCAAYKELGGKVEVNAETGATAGYADADKISAENREAFLWAVQMGIIKGVGENRLDPAGDLTRGQFGTMLERFVKLLAKSAQTAK